MFASIAAWFDTDILPYRYTFEVVGGASVCFFTTYLLAAVDFIQKSAADEFSNFRNPLSHPKSIIWFALIGIVGTIFYLVSLTTDNAFFQTITWGATQPIVRGFAVAGMVTAILRSTLTTYKDSQVGFDGLYAFIQKRFIAACRRDFDLLRLQLCHSFKGKFRDDSDFPNFLNTIVDSEYRALSFSEARRKELRDQYDAARRLLDATSTNELEKRSAIYDSMISVAFSICPISHLRRGLRGRLRVLDQRSNWRARLVHTFFW